MARRSWCLVGLWGLWLLLSATGVSAMPDCYGPYAGGRQVSPEALARILRAHDAWRRNPQGADAQRANLCGADLRGHSLSRKNLAKVNLRGALLNRTSLQNTNLQGADLRQVNAQLAVLGHADFRGALLTQANFRGAYLFKANFQNTTLDQVNLWSASLLSANLQDVRVSRSDLKLAAIQQANLQRSHISHSNLTQVNLKGADLRHATLLNVRLSGANMGASLVANTVFEPSPNALPEVSHFNLVHGLSQIAFHTSPIALITLRDAFKQAGHVHHTRDLTYAINRGLRERAAPLQAALSFVFFELTCLYGLAPTRPLWLLLALTIALSLPYAVCLREDLPKSVATWRGQPHWLRLGIKGFMVSLMALFNFKNSSHDVRLESLRGDDVRQKRWMRGVVSLQRLVSLYLLLLWGFITYWQPFV